MANGLAMHVVECHTGIVQPIAIERGQSYVNQVRKNASVRNITVQTEILVGEGSVSKETEYAENQKIDLIVVGTRGMTGIKKMLLGSTASHVVTYAHCPVLVVR